MILEQYFVNINNISSVNIFPGLSFELFFEYLNGLEYSTSYFYNNLVNNFMVFYGLDNIIFADYLSDLLLKYSKIKKEKIEYKIHLNKIFYEDFIYIFDIYNRTDVLTDLWKLRNLIKLNMESIHSFNNVEIITKEENILKKTNKLNNNIYENKEFIILYFKNILNYWWLFEIIEQNIERITGYDIVKKDYLKGDFFFNKLDSRLAYLNYNFSLNNKNILKEPFIYINLLNNIENSFLIQILKKFSNSFFIFFIYIYLFIFILFNFILFIYIKYKKLNNIIKITTFNCIFLSIFCLILFINIKHFNINGLSFFNNLFFLDNLIINSIIFTFIIFIFYLLIIKDVLFNSIFYRIKYEFIIFVLIVLVSLIFLISSNDFIPIYLSLELQSLCLYLLASFKYFSNFSTEAGLKYFILGAISSGFLLFGISLLYGLTGSLNFENIFIFIKGTSHSNFLENSWFFFKKLESNFDSNDFIFFNMFFNYRFSIFIGFLFILFSFFFKLGLVPFHMWLPDVYQGSPTISTFFFIIIPKIGIIILILKIFLYCLDFNIIMINNLYYQFIDNNLSEIDMSNNVNYFNKLITQFGLFYNSNVLFLLKENKTINYDNLFLICSILSIILGTFSAISQTKIKRLIAFSAITQMGFILINLSTFNLYSLHVILFYLIIYIFLNINLFSIYLSIKDNFTNKKIKNIKDFNNIYKSNILLIYCLLLNMFSLAGIPPLSGFFSKMFVLLNITNKYSFTIFLIIIISAISAYYYINIIKISFFDINKNNKSLKKINKISAYIIILTTLFNLFFFLFPNIFFEYLYNNIILNIITLNIKMIQFIL